MLGRRRVSPVLDRFAIVPPKLAAKLAETLPLRRFRGSTRTAVRGAICGMRHEVIVTQCSLARNRAASPPAAASGKILRGRCQSDAGAGASIPRGGDSRCAEAEQMTAEPSADDWLHQLYAELVAAITLLWRSLDRRGRSAGGADPALAPPRRRERPPCVGVPLCVQRCFLRLPPTERRTPRARPAGAGARRPRGPYG